ncbi:MAG: hypothetical protein AB1668_03110 [Nanoarchaeota archaeon]
MALPPFFTPMFFGTELVYTVIVVSLCFLIYFKTKESYALTKHCGIKYFRNAFLFLGLSYLLRFIFAIAIFSSIKTDIPSLQGIEFLLFAILIITIGYLSTMAIVYLALSSLWKKFESKYPLLIGHCIAILITLIAVLMHSPFILVHLQSLLLLVAFISFLAYTRNKKVPLRILYILTFAFWLINIWFLRPRPFLPLEIRIPTHIISIIIFAIIYYKIARKIQ